MLEGFTSLYSATVVERLLAADAVVLGRTNRDEFAMAPATRPASTVPRSQPAGREAGARRIFRGAAASVAAQVVHAALGSDTGGSIRQPASFTGTVGFKPTYGRVSRFGLIAFASSFDQIGPFAHDVHDAAWVYEAMAGHDLLDNTSSHRPVEPAALGHPPRQVASPTTANAWSAPARTRGGGTPAGHHRPAEVRGHTVSPPSACWSTWCPLTTSWPPPRPAATWPATTAASISGTAAKRPGAWRDHRMSREGFGLEVQRRILLGTCAQRRLLQTPTTPRGRRWRPIREATLRTFQDFDLILMPTSPMTAFELGAFSEDPIAHTCRTSSPCRPTWWATPPSRCPRHAQQWLPLRRAAHGRALPGGPPAAGLRPALRRA